MDSVSAAIIQANGIDWPSWIQAGAAVLTAFVGAVLLYQLSLVKDQIKLSRQQLESAAQWNKLNAAFIYYNSDLVLQRENDAADALAELDINFHTQKEPLTLDQVAAINAEPKIYGRVKSFLSLIEDYCTAVRIGAIDEDAAFAMNSALVMRWEHVFRPFIDDRRVDTGDPEAFCEIEKLATDWREKEKKRAGQHAGELAAARHRLEALRGVQKKV